MANILDTRTVGSEVILVVNSDPATGGGTVAFPSSLAMLDGTANSNGQLYVKFGTADTEWAAIASNGSYVNTGVAGRLALYPATGTAVDDVYAQNSQSIDVNVVAQPTRSAGIQYTIPNPGDAVTAADFVLTEGVQTINGDKTFGNNVTIQGNLDVNGTLTTIDTVNLTVTDKLITLNSAGAAASAFDSGFELEENGVITGYFKTNATRDGWRLKAPSPAGEAIFMLDQLTAARSYEWQDISGTVALQAAAGVNKQVPFFNSTLQLTQETGVSTAAFTWDTATKRLGLSTATPARTLDVAGSSIYRGAMKLLDSNGVNWEVNTASVSTTTAALTTLFTVATSADTTTLVEARIVARRTGGSAGTADDGATYIRTFRVKNAAGTVTVLSVDSMYTSEDQTAWDVSEVVSGTNVNVQVKGATNNNVSWYCTYMVQISA